MVKQRDLVTEGDGLVQRVAPRPAETGQVISAGLCVQSAADDRAFAWDLAKRATSHARLLWDRRWLAPVA
jgi:hypothetical protein